jgi:glycosyltransferase involved in cell wall biosynthesis
MTLVSVIIPCYNLGQYLDEVVDSVLAQTYQEFEIIIVNDGLEDPSTSKIPADYSRSKTRVLTIENHGAGAARNAAIKVAHGSYLCILEAEDKLGPSYLQKAVGILDEDNSIAFVTSCPRNPGDEGSASAQKHLDLTSVLSDSTLTTPALVRRTAVIEVGGYDEDPHQSGSENWLLWISLAERGYRGAILPEKLSHYEKRAVQSSVSGAQAEPHREKFRCAIAKHEDSYRRHLLDVLIRMEARSCDLLKISYATERHLDTWLIPLVRRRRDEVERLRAKLETVQQEERLALRLDELKQEIIRLRNSRSWKITAPLRAIYDRLLQLTGRPIPRS